MSAAPGPALSVAMLPADHGDCLWVECRAGSRRRRLLVDCGTRGTWARLRPRIEALPPRQRRFELLVVSHVDADHIGGVLPFLADGDIGVRLGDVWFNGLRHLPAPSAAPGPAPRGPAQGDDLAGLLAGGDGRRPRPWNAAFDGERVCTAGPAGLRRVRLRWGLTLTLLSPTPERLGALRPVWEREVARVRKGLPSPQTRQPPPPPGRPRAAPSLEELAGAASRPDRTAPNGSSIALLAEFAGRRVVLAADAFPDVLVPALRAAAAERGEDRLAVDAFKLPHHGSQGNVTAELVESVRCRRWLFSTSGEIFGHPDAEAVARVVLHGGPRPQLWFNYRSGHTLRWADPALRRRHRYDVRYPRQGTEGLTLRL